MRKLLVTLALGLALTASLAAQDQTSWSTIPVGFDKEIITFIIDQSFDAEIDPELILAVIAIESQWDIKAKNYNASSKTTDWGLMQLNSKFIEDYIARFGKPGKKYDPVHNVYDNLELGIKYFASLYHYWGGDTLMALYSYNCGFGRTSSGKIPSSTISYALSVLNVYNPSYLRSRY